MRSLRQLGGGVIIALVSAILVIGGISLSLAETFPSQATPSPIPPTLPQIFPTPITPTATAAPVLSETPTNTETATLFPINTPLQPTICALPGGWVRITTTSNDTIYSIAQRYKTTAEILSAANCLASLDLPIGYGLFVPPIPTVTVIPCGPPAGWVKKHVVQRGDNLYRIALSYGLAYPQLQRANCMGSSTTIYAGQVLWVPNIPTLTPIPGVTVVPNSPTSTYTPVPTATTLPPTSTPPPTPTVTASPVPASATIAPSDTPSSPPPP